VVVLKVQRLKKKKVENRKINPTKVNDGRLMGRNMTDTHLSSLQNAVDESCLWLLAQRHNYEDIWRLIKARGKYSFLVIR
jgi:hypothetical protein